MSDTPQLRRVIAVLPQPNVVEAVDFYRERLNFEQGFIYDDYAGVCRDGVEIHFWQCADRKIAEQTSCRIEVEGIDALYAQCQQAAIVHSNGHLELKPWGYREFSAVDGAGNLLVFAERSPDYRA